MIIGALGMVHRRLEQWLERVGIKEDFTMLHKACLLRTVRTLRLCVECLRSRDLTWYQQQGHNNNNNNNNNNNHNDNKHR